MMMVGHYELACWYNATVLYLSVLFALQKENTQMNHWLEKKHF